MTSVRNELEELFSWNPPRLIHIPVVRLPSLVQDLADIVDKALDAASGNFPPLDDFITARQRAGDRARITRRAPDEHAVATYYNITTSRYCASVASTLALHPNASLPGWRSLLCWTESSAPSTNYAIMDGLLRFIEDDDETNETWATTMESMKDEDRCIIKEMEKSGLALATWAMKSTRAGSAEVMNAVLNLGKFNWTFCDPSGECSSHQKARADVVNVRVGSDAKVPLWNLPNDSSNTSLDSEQGDEETDIQPVASSSSTLQRPVTQRAALSAASGSSMPPPPQPSASRSSKHGYPTKDKGKKRKRDDDDAYHETAQSLAQQAWAQAIKVDGTLIVLHSGNHEIVCVRHRSSKTLYVSDVIQPPTCVDPGYGKLHVGIYIAAVQDAMNRWREKPPGGDLIGGDNDQDDEEQDDQDHNQGSGRGCNRGGRGHREVRRRGHKVVKRKIGRFQCSARRKSPPDDELGAIEKMIHVASNRNVVLLYLQYGVYYSPIPASFLRSAPSICPTPPFSPRAIRTYGLEECLTIVLTSEIGRGSTGVVHRSTLEVEVCDGVMPLDVVVKLAFDTGQRDALRSEYEVYRHLRSKGVLQGIPIVLGLFDDSEGAACALVMLYAGVPLVKESQHILSVSDCNLALSTLESIHHAGILHGDIRRDNILMGDSGLTIIDFGHSKQCDNQKAKDKEFARLRYLLGLPHASD